MSRPLHSGRTGARSVAARGKRKEGPLFLSAQGTRINTDSSLDQWRAAASLAFVDLEWPQGEPRSLKMAYLVHYALMSGRVRVAMGGPLSGPSSPGSQKRAARKRLAAQVGRIADAMREGWDERMHGVDLVTEMKKVKHYYDQGVSARVGIEK